MACINWPSSGPIKAHYGMFTVTPNMKQQFSLIFAIYRNKALINAVLCCGMIFIMQHMFDATFN